MVSFRTNGFGSLSNYRIRQNPITRGRKAQAGQSTHAINKPIIGQGIQPQTAPQGTSLNQSLNLLMSGLGTLSGGNSKSTSATPTTSVPKTTPTTTAQNAATPTIATSPSGLASVGAAPTVGNTSINNVQDAYSSGTKLDAMHFKQQVIDAQVNPLVEQVSSNRTEAMANKSILDAQKTEAQNTVQSLQGSIDSTKEAADAAQNRVDADKKTLDQNTKARDDMDKQLSAINKDYQTACEDVKSKESDKSAAQSKVSECESGVTTAEGDLKSAESELNGAEKALQNTPKTLKDGKPNPQYQVALNARDAAKVKKEQAKKTLDKAKDELKKAKEDLQKKNELLKEAQNKKGELQNKLSQTESNVGRLAKDCQKMEGQVQKSQENYDKSVEQNNIAQNNYDRLNQELESANGIITQSEEYDNRIQILDGQLNKAKELQTKAYDTLKEKEGSMTQEQIKAQAYELNDECSVYNTHMDAENQMIINAFDGRGTAGNKTPNENLITLHEQGYDYSKEKIFHTRGIDGIGGSGYNSSEGIAETMLQEGYVRNDDGSLTHARSGKTIARYDEREYANTTGGYFKDTAYYNASSERNRKQKGSMVIGYTRTGIPVFKWQ